MPHADRGWTLQGRRRRRRAANDNEPTVEIRQCPQCYAVHDPAPACPSCGFRYKPRVAAPPRQVDGQLVEVPDEAAAQSAARAARLAQGKARTLDALVAQGMSEGRARHIIHAREEKARLQEQVRDLLRRWYAAAGRPAPAARAVFETFGFQSTDVRTMKPKALRAAVERVTEELLRLQLGAPANDNSGQAKASA